MKTKLLIKPFDKCIVMTKKKPSVLLYFYSIKKSVLTLCVCANMGQTNCMPLMCGQIAYVKCLTLHVDVKV